MSEAVARRSSLINPIATSAVDMTETVLVCGGRNFNDYALLSDTLAALHKERKIGCVISGGATGADTFALEWAERNMFNTHRFPADWKTHGNFAGIKRNQQMLDEGKPTLVIAFPGGKGTADMVRRARASNIEVIEVSSDG